MATDLDDGFWYGDIKYRELTEQGEYGAYRFECAFQIGTPDHKKIHKLSRIHIDVGFGDRLPSMPSNDVMSSLLPTIEPVAWKIYPIEFIVSEKLQTLMDRGSENSRAKDVYDLNYFFPKCQEPNLLIVAIKKTFENRQTKLPDSFAKQASQFERSILSHGWPGMKTFTDKTDFETAWGKLMGFLKELDQKM